MKAQRPAHPWCPHHTYFRAGVDSRKTHLPLPCQVPKNSDSGRKPKRLFLTGLHPKAFPRSVRDFVDADYVDKLNPEEQRWLAAFNEGHYGGDFRRDPFGVSKETRRETYRAKNAANRDLYAYAQAGGTLTADPNLTYRDEENADPRDLQPTQSYLDDPEYKAALAGYRDLLPQVANRKNKFSSERKLEQARRRLDQARRKESPHVPTKTATAPTAQDPDAE